MICNTCKKGELKFDVDIVGGCTCSNCDYDYCYCQSPDIQTNLTCNNPKCKIKFRRVYELNDYMAVSSFLNKHIDTIVSLLGSEYNV